MRGAPSGRPALAPFIGALVAATVAIVVIAAYVYARQAQAITNEAAARVRTVGGLKADLLDRWRRERMSDGVILAGSDAMRAVAARATAAPGAGPGAGVTAAFRAAVEPAMQANRYSNALLLRPDRRLLVAVEPAVIGPTTDTAVVAALASRRTEISNLYRGSDDNLVHVDVVSPIVDARGTPAAVLILRVNAEDHIFPILRSWPSTPDVTAAVLIRRFGDNVTSLAGYASPDSVVRTILLSDTSSVAVRGALGRRGVVEGTGHRGTRVIADIRGVPGAPWILSTETDIATVSGQLAGRRRLILLAALGALGAVVLAVMLAYAQRRAELLRVAVDRVRAETEASLRTAESFFAVFNAVPVAMMMSDAETGRFVAVNDEAIRASRFPREEFVGHTSAEMGWIAPGERDEKLAALARDGRIVGAELRTTTRDGREQWGRFYAGYVRMGERTYILGVLLDETAAREARQALRTSEARFRAVIENTFEGVSFIDRNGTVLFRSRAYDRITGHASANHGGQARFDLVHADDRERVRGAFQRALVHPHEPVRTHFRVLHSAGHAVPVEGTFVGFTDVPEINAVVVFVRDVSDRVRAEAERERLYEMLVHAQKSEAVGQLAGGVAHDFNNILTALAFEVEALRAGVPRDEMDASLEEMSRQVERATALTRQLLLFSRRQPARMAPVELNALVSNLLKMLRRLIGEHLTIEFAAEGGERWVMADAGMVEQVITNLVVNARDATPPGGRIALRTRVTDVSDADRMGHRGGGPGRYVVLEVADTGVGMAPDVAARVFEPFYTTKPPGKGTGLGLATVAAIVEQHGGWVDLRSAPGSGTSVFVYLPESAPGSASQARREQRAIPGGTEHVLVVEDDAAVRRGLVRMLQAAGYRVSEASSGQEALDLWSGLDPVDLVLTDLMMPGGATGLDLVDALRARRPGVKVILMSGYSHGMIEPGQLAARGVHFIAKPMTREALARVMREALEERPGAAS